MDVKVSSGAFFRLAATESNSVAFGYSSPHPPLRAAPRQPSAMVMESVRR
ncbi:uncharacterized protein G2W53_018297 [Senna tora]|uniref:Uncharacterized protein n=1 Tax=Senna tora TaxID=362788 RepID=A0A834WN73_9FABA|nr:uncharacterized protein G2W53_018297 [Senna tora]